MFSRRFAHILSILLISCSVHGQRIQLQLPFAVSVVVNNHSTEGEKEVWTFELEPNVAHRVQLFSDDKLVASKQLTLSESESRVYIIEEIDDGKYELFFRDLPFVEAGLDVLTPQQESISVVAVLEEVQEEEPQVETVYDSVAVTEIEQVLTSSHEAESHEEALERIGAMNYEFEKTKEMISWCENYTATTDQIRGFADLLSYDPSKFMLLQRLFPVCSDQDNYSQLEDVLQYDNFKNQFKEWLATQNQP